MRPRAHRPTPALVISVIALFVSLGGVGYAAATVTSSDVRNNSLTSRDVRNNSLTGRDVRNSSLTGRDVRRNSLTGSDVRESRLGEVPSAASADSARIAQVQIISATGTAPASGDAAAATATCPAGLKVVGGGTLVEDPASAFVVDLWPSSATAYTGRVASGNGADQGFTVQAICASAA
jgi:hypothetical protein